jgi:hypothetical protein
LIVPAIPEAGDTGENMVIYGWRGSVVSGGQIQDMECPNCGNNLYQTFGILQYFHIFWIPLFPYSRKPGMECQNCKHTQVGKEIRDPTRGKIKASVFTMARTAPKFAGLALVAAFVAFIAVRESREAEQERLYMENPAIGDMYVIKVSKTFEGGDPEYDYALMRVESVDAEQVGFKLAFTHYNIARGPKDDIGDGKADSPDYYDDPVHLFATDELRAIHEDGGIRSIHRKEE